MREKAEEGQVMARIANFIYCVKTERDVEGICAKGVLTALSPEKIPGDMSFSVLCSVTDIEEGTHNIIFRFINPDGKILVETGGDAAYEKNKNNNIPKEHTGLNICLNFMNVEMEKAGIYKTEVTVDGDICGVYEIYGKGKNEE